MEEQSDTPRTDAAAQFVSHFGWQVHADFARTLERELATATRERDEARAIANDRDAMVDHRDRALTAMYQRVDVITRERDEARAEVERLRSTFVHCHVRGSSGDLCAVCGLDLRDKVHTAATEAKP
mgnify:CR=1 FL=1